MKRFSVTLITLAMLAFLTGITSHYGLAQTTWTVDDDDGLADFTSIQAAIDAAGSGDTIHVAAGTYPEYLHITTDHLTIIGAGIDQSIIDLDGLIPYWHYAPNKSFASRAGVLISGWLSPGTTPDVVEGVTFKGFTVKNAGLNPPITATGNHTGEDAAATLTDSSASWGEDELVDQWVHNVSDKLIEIDIEGNNPIRSYGLITANTDTTVIATLAGGLDNDWDVGDTYEILPYEQYVDVAEDLQDDVPGIGIGNGKDISILYCKVINNGSNGITAGKARLVATHKYSEGLTIDHCIVSDNPNRGITMGTHAGAVIITNNVCSNNGSPHPTDPSREYQGTGIYVAGRSSSQMASGLIANNECENNGFVGISVAKYTGGVIVENNTVTGHNFDQDGDGIQLSHWGKPQFCKNHIIRNNNVTGNIRGIVVYYAQGCTIENNTFTTDSGSFPQGQGAIKLDNANNITVIDNTISSCDGTGITIQSYDSVHNSSANTFTDNIIRGAKFAGVLIYGPGAQDNTFTENTITGTTVLKLWGGKSYEETAADGVFIDDDAGAGNVFHHNNIYHNHGDGMENQVAMVDATCNWWGNVSGPSGVVAGTGDAVRGLVDFDPWLIVQEGLCEWYDEIHALMDNAKNPGKFVRLVTEFADGLVEEDEITESEAVAIISWAARAFIF